MYLNIIVWVILVGLFVKGFGIYKIEKINGERLYRWSYMWAIIMFFPIFWLACRGTPINDVPVYLSAYQKLSLELSELKEYIFGIESGQGFVVIEVVIKSIFGNDVAAFRMIIALIHSLPIIYIYRKYSEEFGISIYLFVASACHIAWMMNGLRQFIAVVMIFVALPLMIEKKYIKLIIVVLLASTIHTSAFLMLPVVFIVQGKAWNAKTILFIITSIFAMFVFRNNVTLVDSFLVGTEYAGAMATMKELGDNGTNPIRVLVDLVPVGIAYLEREHLRVEKNRLVHICVNMSLITVGIDLIAMVTSGILIGRLAIYTKLYNFLIMPYLIKNCFTDQSKKIVNIAMVFCYFVYYCFEMGVL